jgi:rRNA-processing protein FCF1
MQDSMDIREQIKEIISQFSLVAIQDMSYEELEKLEYRTADQIIALLPTSKSYPQEYKISISKGVKT